MAQAQPLNVSIVGAGIAGLAAATALRRNGHRVQIFESAETKTEIGAAIVVPLNAQRVLEYLGYKKENLKSVDLSSMVTFNAAGEGKQSFASPWIEIDGKVAVTCVRSDLHNELLRLATGPGEGPPAVVNFASEVVKCDPERGSLTLTDGRVVQSDLILGADGISSVIRTHVLGHVQKALHSGLTNCRTLLDVAKLDAVPELSWLREGTLGPRMVIPFGVESDEYRWLFLYPCRSGELLNFIALLDDQDQANPDWHPSVTRETLLSKFAAFPSQFRTLLEIIPEKLPRWQIRYVPVLPTWVKGYAALLGDAAHATLPTLGQGAAQAVEDAGALGLLLPSSTKRAEIPERLEAYHQLRKERVERITRESYDQMTVPKERGKFSRDLEFQKYVMGYDVLAAAREVLDREFVTKKGLI
ncbi:FAD/NAD(P)-binding domain-containing protein [Favolaschia claudopus]|uniref:FAD/NAD(P)-binding domain-containing protein n=1 Tax=Favolaschia claudopus TaxID=2862362 RepID=A0AAW0A907_9AGAR